MTSIAFNSGSYFGNAGMGNFSSLTVNNGSPAHNENLFGHHHAHHHNKRKHHPHHPHRNMAMNQTPPPPFGGMPQSFGMNQGFGMNGGMGFGMNQGFGGMNGGIDNIRTAPFDVPYGVNVTAGNNIFGGGNANFANVSTPSGNVSFGSVANGSNLFGGVIGSGIDAMRNSISHINSPNANLTRFSSDVDLGDKIVHYRRTVGTVSNSIFG